MSQRTCIPIHYIPLHREAPLCASLRTSVSHLVLAWSHLSVFCRLLFILPKGFSQSKNLSSQSLHGLGVQHGEYNAPPLSSRGFTMDVFLDLDATISQNSMPRWSSHFPHINIIHLTASIMISSTSSSPRSCQAHSTTSRPLSQSTTLNASHPALSSLSPPTLPSQTPDWASKALSELDALSRLDAPSTVEAPNPKSHPISRWTKFATRLSAKLPSCFTTTGPFSKFASRNAHTEDTLSQETRLFTELCDNLGSVVRSCVKLGEIETECAGMSRYMHDRLVPVHTWRNILDEEDVSEG